MRWPSSIDEGAAYLKKKYNITLNKPVGANLDQTIDGAAYTSLRAMYPLYDDFFKDSNDTGATASFNFGRDIARALLEQRSGDGSANTAPPAPPLDYGSHRVDPYNPSQNFSGRQWGAIGAM